MAAVPSAMVTRLRTAVATARVAVVRGLRRVPRRTPGEWAVRGVVAVALVTAGIVAASFSTGQATVRTGRALAYRLAPYDGRNAAQLSFDLSQADVTPAQRARADRLARAALAREPLATTALSTLALDASIRGETARAAQLFAHARALSRRDMRTQLFMIEAAVERGDIVGAVHEYDITLRVLPALSDLLYPVLAAASEDREIRAPLVRTLAARPTWADSFIAYMAGPAADPRIAATLFTDLTRARIAVPDAARTAVVDGLLERADPDAAWRYYASLRGGADRRRSRDPRFDAVLAAPSQLDWKPVEDGRVYTTLADGVAAFTAPSGTGGPLLTQRQQLPAGDYVLRGRGGGVDAPERERPYWTLVCGDGRELGRIVLPSSDTGGGAFAGRFRVPRDCPAQTLQLVARASDAIGGVSGEITAASLEPAA